MAEWIVTPVIALIKCCVRPIKRQAGYLFQHEKKIQKLRSKVQTLMELRSDLQLRVTLAKRNLETIYQEVTGWFLDVDRETTENEKMVGLMNGLALDQVKQIKHFTRRYGVGKLISKKTTTIDSLILKGRGFSRISSGGLVHGVDFLRKDPEFESFLSRQSVVDEVMDALRDDKINLFGVYGMGGIGKTMLINQICNQVQNDKLFEVVIIVTVSQNVELKNIQAKIADELESEDIKKREDVATRAALLSERLMEEQSILIVLDDLWTENFYLHHVGIPYGHCKVVITSRIRKQYCGCHEFQKNIEVKTIEEDESWDLFNKWVGVHVPNTDVAREIIKECNGLPIALVVLARALRNQDTEISGCEGMNEIVYCSIKLSYVSLKNDIEKRCFLLCCLFPEDYKITVVNELMMYFICDTNLHGFTKLKEAKVRLLAVLQVLTDSCLLLCDERKSVVWMHDIIRDVAISIASEEHGFLVQAGKAPEWSKLLSSSSSANHQRLSLMRSSISSLPDLPELPHLVSMSLEGNETLKSIPDGYYQGMRRMETLDLRSTGISKLPPSLSFLVSLRTLYLDYCVFDPSTDISLVGYLKKLVILSLQGCNLERLPTEIGELTGLKSLNLSRNKSLQVPPNVLSRLSQLEELYMKESFTGWEIEGWKSEMKASLEELTSLIKEGALTTLHFSLDKRCREVLSEDDGPRRIHLDVTFGLRTGLDYRSCHNFLDLTVSPPICQIIAVLLERVQTLQIKKSNDLKSVAQTVPTHVGFKNMKSLGIEECNDMKFLMRVQEAVAASNAFSAMEDLVISSMDNLEQLFDGPVPIGFIEKLKRLTVIKCNKMVSIFDSNLLKRMPNLDALRIEGCEMLKEIFNLEEPAEPTPREGSDNVSTCLKLGKMHLEILPSLEIICKGVIPNGGFDNLLEVELYICDRMKHLFSLDTAAGFRQLKILKIRFCLRMVNLIAPEEDMVECSSTVVSPEFRLFPKLESLLIEHCYNFEQLWVAKTLVESDRNPVLPALRTLELRYVPKLTDLHQGSTSLDYPCLQHLEVVMCPNLKRICLSHQRTPKLKKILGNDETWFQSIEWENPADKQYMRQFFSAYAS